MIDNGWIKLKRSIKSNWVWKEKPFSAGQAWIELFMSCNHSREVVKIKGIKISCDRGETCKSVKTFAKDWGWSPGKCKGKEKR